MNHLLASLPPEYSYVVDHVKIDLRKKTYTLTELKKLLKEKYLQLQKEKECGEDEMTLSASQNSARFQKKGTNPRQTPRFKGRCHHCSKWGHKKEHYREWLKLIKEQQEQADKEKSEENPRKYLRHRRCYNCSKMGHFAKDSPEKKSRDSGGGSSGGFAMMCTEGMQSLVEEDPKSKSDKGKA